MGFLFEMVSEGATEIQVRMRERIVASEVTNEVLEVASEVVYRATDTWFETHGEGRWPPLAESTLKEKARKQQPSDPLVASGAFKESVTSAHGPQSFHMPVPGGIAFGVDWEKGGWQIPVVHFYGTHTAGVDHDVTIPARPAWPAHDSIAYRDMRDQLTALLLRGER